MCSECACSDVQVDSCPVYWPKWSVPQLHGPGPWEAPETWPLPTTLAFAVGVWKYLQARGGSQGNVVPQASSSPLGLHFPPTPWLSGAGHLPVGGSHAALRPRASCEPQGTGQLPLQDCTFAFQEPELSSPWLRVGNLPQAHGQHSQPLGSLRKCIAHYRDGFLSLQILHSPLPRLLLLGHFLEVLVPMPT